MKSGRRLASVLLPGCLLPGLTLAQESYGWAESFGYSEGAMSAIEIRDFGYPWVPVGFGDDTIWLPFDTGNMVGLTLSTQHFRRLALPCTEKWDRLDSSGRVVSTGCTAHGVQAAAFGTDHDSVSVFEFFHESLPGLAGPDLLPGTRFTLDYRNGILASDDRTGPESVPGFESLPLVRSSRHPLLILVVGRVRGEEVLMEIDTGKSRTTIDRALVTELGLAEEPGGVRIGTVGLGSRSWEVASARVVDTSGISADLPGRIGLGIGSDVLDDFVFTVDYRAGRLWIELADLDPRPVHLDR